MGVFVYIKSMAIKSGVYFSVKDTSYESTNVRKTDEKSYLFNTLDDFKELLDNKSDKGHTHHTVEVFDKNEDPIDSVDSSWVDREWSK